MADATSGFGDLGGGIGDIVGGAAVLLGAGGKGGDASYKQALAVLMKVQDPNYDFSDITAPELQVFKTVFPEQYSAYVPDSVKTITEDPGLRLTQMKSLKRFEDTADQGLPLSERLAGQEAGRRIATESQRANEAAISDVAARGRLGTSGELAARLQANQGQSELERGLGSDLAQSAIATRQNAAGQAANLASGIRGQDYTTSAANANILNTFAQNISNLKTEEAMRNAQARQEAQNYNAGTAQRIGETNILNRSATQEANLNRRNQLQQALSDFRLRKAGAQAAAYTGYGNIQQKEKGAREQSIKSLAGGIGNVAGSALAFA